MNVNLIHYLIREHCMNSVLLAHVSQVPVDKCQDYICGRKVRKNYAKQIELGMCLYLLRMKDTSQELEALLED